HGLTVLEDSCTLSARMEVNQVSMKTENERITSIIRGFQDLLREDGSQERQV
ncbi:MAG: ATP phosphoribosyltransferase, partial [Clostridium sp.]|nr:ATP phosphoribosyltransferase [Clostridium sp.]